MTRGPDGDTTMTETLLSPPLTAVDGEGVSPDGYDVGRSARPYLTARQVEILGMVAEGLLLREIAKRLFISLETVKTHTSASHIILGTHNLPAAVARAYETGILTTVRERALREAVEKEWSGKEAVMILTATVKRIMEWDR